ncbi:hypothetical protein GPJ56_006171 [Histomonas meleagridis]|uniref:uncharacterized protein n=1 Tax=Histomonas meleagridis TaxID=135588 RepID=UPI00355A2F8E|nr:hypothetical protein GPJ56_006171 [Histomonas meleagridis]KAH0797013.1 hypothetical protein GO595_010906 [Histomonas meleagridis]
MSESSTKVSNAENQQPRYVESSDFKKAIKRLNNKIKDMQKQISESILSESIRQELETLRETIREQGKKIEELTDEKKKQIEKLKTPTPIRTHRRSTKSVRLSDTETNVAQIAQLRDMVQSLKEDLENTKTNDIQPLVQMSKSKKRHRRQKKEPKEDLEREASDSNFLTGEPSFTATDEKPKVNSDIEKIQAELAKFKSDLQSIQSKSQEQEKEIKKISTLVKHGEKPSLASLPTTDSKGFDVNFMTQAMERFEELISTVQEHDQMLSKQSNLITQQNDELTVQRELFDKKFASNISRIKMMEKMIESINNSLQSLRNDIKALQRNSGGGADQATLDQMKEKLFKDIDDKINKIKNRFLETFADKETADNLRQKLANQKSTFKHEISDLNGFIKDEAQKREDALAEMQNKVNQVQQILENLQEKSSMEAKITKDQLRKLSAQVATGGSPNNSQPGIPSEFALDLDEFRLRIEQLEQDKKKSNERANAIIAKQEEIDKSLNESLDDIKSRISNMEYVSSKDHEEFIDKLRQVEENNSIIRSEMEQCPIMISHSIDENNAAIDKFKEKVNKSLSEIQNQLKQASFADDEIDEIRISLKKFTKHIKSEQRKLDSRLDTIEHKLNQEKDSNNDITQIKDKLEQLRLEIDVQNNTTNPLFTQQLSELRNLITGDNTNDKESSESPIKIAQQIDIEKIKKKMVKIEDIVQQQNISIDKTNDAVKDIHESNDIFTRKIYREIESIYHTIPDKVDESPVVLGIKEEIKTLENTINIAIEDKENFKNKLNEIISNNNNNNNNETSQQYEKIGDNNETSNTEINELKLAIDGIEMNTQRQIRKLKRTVKKVQHALEDAIEDEKEEKEKKEKTQRKRRRSNTQRKQHKQKDINDKEEDGSVTERNIELEDDDSKELLLTDENENANEEKESKEVVRADDEKMKAVEELQKNNVVKELLRDDFGVMFTLMFAVLLYFLVTDIVM